MMEYSAEQFERWILGENPDFLGDLSDEDLSEVGGRVDVMLGRLDTKRGEVMTEILLRARLLLADCRAALTSG